MELLEGRLKEISRSLVPGLGRPPTARFNLVHKYLSGGKHIMNSLVSESALVGKAAVENAVIGPGARIEDHAVVKRSVVLDGAVVRKGAVVREALVEPNVEIKPKLLNSADEAAARGLKLHPGLHLMEPFPGFAPLQGPQPFLPPAPKADPKN
jgi:hypothetical protein